MERGSRQFGLMAIITYSVSVLHLDAIAVDEARVDPRREREEAPKPECICPDACPIDHGN